VAEGTEDNGHLASCRNDHTHEGAEEDHHSHDNQAGQVEEGNVHGSQQGEAEVDSGRAQAQAVLVYSHHNRVRDWEGEGGEGNRDILWEKMAFGNRGAGAGSHNESPWEEGSVQEAQIHHDKGGNPGEVGEDIRAGYDLSGGLHYYDNDDVNPCEQLSTTKNSRRSIKLTVLGDWDILWINSLGEPRERKLEGMNGPCPMTHLPTFETSSGIARVLCSPAAAMREFYTNFVSHEIALVIFSNAFFSSFPTVEFL